MKEAEMKQRRRKEVDRKRVMAEDLLKGVAHQRDMDGQWRPEDLGVSGSGEQLAAGLGLLEAEGYAQREAEGWKLTKKGHDRALELLRTHRLVETYLARTQGLSAGDLHERADAEEHLLTRERANELADWMNRPRFDPHGDPIPERARDLVETQHRLLTESESGDRVIIAHIEDEPIEDFRKLMEMGLAPELPLEVLYHAADGVGIRIAGETLKLSLPLAGHVEIYPFPEDREFPEGLRRLSSLRPGQNGWVEFISAACQGPERRRLLDFGMVPGSEVRCEYSSPFGSPVAYCVRGTTLGLRRSQAEHIFIRRET